MRVYIRVGIQYRSVDQEFVVIRLPEDLVAGVLVCHCKIIAPGELGSDSSHVEVGQECVLLPIK